MFGFWRDRRETEKNDIGFTVVRSIKPMSA